MDKNILPICYVNPKDPTTCWICDYDEQHKITSIYFQKGRRLCGYFDDLENVKCQEQLLKDYGWIKGNRPTINIKFENDSE